MSQITALSISIAVEALVVGLVMFFFMSGTTKNYKNIFIAMLTIASATLLTHPFAWMLNQHLQFQFSFPVRATFIEIAVIIAETIVLALIISSSKKRCLVLATAANTASFLFGLALFAIR